MSLKGKDKSEITLIKLDIFKYIIISEELNIFFSIWPSLAFWLFCLIFGPKFTDLIWVPRIELLLILPPNTLGGTKLRLKTFPQSKNNLIPLYRGNWYKQLGASPFAFLAHLHVHVYSTLKEGHHMS